MLNCVPEGWVCSGGMVCRVEGEVQGTQGGHSPMTGPTATTDAANSEEEGSLPLPLAA